jgi:hypothetical protein
MKKKIKENIYMPVYDIFSEKMIIFLLENSSLYRAEYKLYILKDA